MSTSVNIKIEKMIFAMAEKQYKCSDLAKASGVSRATISYIVNGKSCKTDIAGKLAKALGMDVKELIELKKEQTQ